jgi:recombination protein RecA
VRRVPVMEPAPERHEIVEQLRRDIARRFPGVVRPATPAAPAGPPAGGHPTGHPALDALLPGGGFPAGRIVTIAGSASSGKLSVALAAVARATAGGACCAFIDTGGEFFPPSAAACGIDLERLLVVRAPPPAVPRATCVTLQSRAFALVVLDLSRRAAPGAAPGLTAAQVMRLGALCREADVTLLALGAAAALRPLAPAAALRLCTTRILSGRGADGDAPRQFTGTRVALEGCAAAPPATVELHLVRHAAYCLRPTARLRLAGPPAGQRR